MGEGYISVDPGDSSLFGFAVFGKAVFGRTWVRYTYTTRLGKPRIGNRTVDHPEKVSSLRAVE